MNNTLEAYLLEAVGKAKEEIPAENPYRTVGFDKDKKRLGWLRVVPFADIKAVLEKTIPFLENKENFIFVGMGGSINGIKPLFSFFKTKSLYALDSLDPAALKNIIKKIKHVDKTLIIAISKSGTTQETQLLSGTLKELFPVDWKSHFLWLTDKTAFEKLDGLGWAGTVRFPIQFDTETDVGGRFSSPHTLIFFLPLFILLKYNSKKLETIYKKYVALQGKVRAQAYRLAEKSKDASCAYFSPKVKGSFGKSFISWIVQMFQESLGSKKDSLAVKTTPAKIADNRFMPVGLSLGVTHPVVSLMSQMYFFQVFIAFYAGLKGVNFVDQDFVEKYKEEMRKLSSEAVSDITPATLGQVIEKVKKNAGSTYQFIEVVLYFCPSEPTIRAVHNEFTKAFKDKHIFLFIGSDWNHHSYQAAFSDKKTYYVFLVCSPYASEVTLIARETLRKNIDTLKLISKATYLTLKDKSLLFSLNIS
ncbi:MAG: hypothetical protein WCI77_01220 [Candidatus Omnitrophota bacterium]